jgi:hypothetical protein
LGEASDATTCDNRCRPFHHWRYVVEAALAHASGDKVEAAYARSDVLAKRRKLMEAWQEFCASKPAAATKDKNIVALRSA